MNAFLGELAKKLAEKWLTLLVLPGVLFLAVCAAGRTLGQDHWSNVGILTASAKRLTVSLAGQGSIAVGLVMVVILLAAGVISLATQGLAQGLQRVWLGEWPPPHRYPARRFVVRRNRKWQLLQDQYASLVHSNHGERAITVAKARNQISLARPSRATWMGDRMASVEQRVHSQYGLDLVAAWPRLWLVVSDTTRTELRQAHGRFDTAVTLAAWGLLYLLLGLWWWPAAFAGCGIYLIGWCTGRGAAAELAQLIEATIDLNGPALADALGIPADGSNFSPDIGQEITRRLRKGA